MEGAQRCPLCRAEFTTLQTFPSLKDDGAWFAALADGFDALSKDELLDALTAILPLTRSDVTSLLDATEYDWSMPMDRQSFRYFLAPWLTADLPVPAPTQASVPVLSSAGPAHPQMASLWDSQPFGANNKIVRDGGYFYLEGGNHYVGHGRWVGDRFCCAWGRNDTWIGTFSLAGVRSCLVNRPFRSITNEEVIRAACNCDEGGGGPNMVTLSLVAA